MYRATRATSLRDTSSDCSITKPLTLVVEKTNRDLTATQSSVNEVIFEAKSVAGTTSEATKVLLDTINANVAFNVARALELKSFKTRDGQFAIRIAELSSDSSISLDELSTKTGSLVSAQKTISLQKKSVLSQHHQGPLWTTCWRVRRRRPAGYP